MDDFDKELEELASAFDKDEDMRLFRRRFEESQLWQEHKRHHEEQGTQAHLVVWEDVAPIQPTPMQQEEQAIPDRKHIKVGGCECQPRFAFMQADDNGSIVAGIPTPVEEAQAYTATTSYNAASGPVQTVYNAQPGGQKDLYR